jgi:hypothetical protein
MLQCYNILYNDTMTILTMTLIITTSLIMAVIGTQYGWHYLYNITYSLSVKPCNKCDIACMFLHCMYVFCLFRKSQEMATFGQLLLRHFLHFNLHKQTQNCYRYFKVSKTVLDFFLALQLFWSLFVQLGEFFSNLLVTLIFNQI